MDITKIVDKYFRPFVASAAAIFLIPWVLYLELVLPTHYEAYHWRGAWVGFDIGLVVFLAATAILGFLRSHLLSIAAFATGVLLLVDVWFDIMTASPHDRPTSIITGVCGNIPLALILMGIGIKSAAAFTSSPKKQQTISRTTYDRRGPNSPRANRDQLSGAAFRRSGVHRHRRRGSTKICSREEHHHREPARRRPHHAWGAAVRAQQVVESCGSGIV